MIDLKCVTDALPEIYHGVADADALLSDILQKEVFTGDDIGAMQTFYKNTLMRSVTTCKMREKGMLTSGPYCVSKRVEAEIARVMGQISEAYGTQLDDLATRYVQGLNNTATLDRVFAYGGLAKPLEGEAEFVQRVAAQVFNIVEVPRNEFEAFIRGAVDADEDEVIARIGMDICRTISDQCIKSSGQTLCTEDLSRVRATHVQRITELFKERVADLARAEYQTLRDLVEPGKRAVNYLMMHKEANVGSSDILEVVQRSWSDLKDAAIKALGKK